MPHKQTILQHLDSVDITAQKIGAVNTVKIEGEKLIGYNTDAHGFIAPLKQEFGDLAGAKVAICGAGGAARACVYALKQEKADVTLFARHREKAEIFGKEFKIRTGTIDQANVTGFDVVVNSTPLGMKGSLENNSVFSAEQLIGVDLVYDLVTKPTDTPLVCEARKAGARTISGINMLVEQGAMQFELWTGTKAPLSIMKEAVLTKIRQMQL